MPYRQYLLGCHGVLSMTAPPKSSGSLRPCSCNSLLTCSVSVQSVLYLGAHPRSSWAEGISAYLSLPWTFTTSSHIAGGCLVGISNHSGFSVPNSLVLTAAAFPEAGEEGVWLLEDGTRSTVRHPGTFPGGKPRTPTVLQPKAL